MKKLIFIGLMLLVQACSHVWKVDVSHSDSAFKGPLSEVSPLVFISPVLEDKRAVQDNVGFKKQGVHSFTTQPTTPVQDVISNAIKTAMEKNGHKFNSDGRIKITGSIDRFWQESKANLMTVETMGTVQGTLEFIDTKTEKTIYKSTYSGTHSVKTAANGAKKAEEVLNKAIDNFIEDIVFDEELIDALDNI